MLMRHDVRHNFSKQIITSNNDSYNSFYYYLHSVAQDHFIMQFVKGKHMFTGL